MNALTKAAPQPSTLDAMLEKMMVELSSAYTAPLVLLGDRLDLFRTLAAQGPMSARALADATGTDRRYIREWASAMAAAGYVVYDAAADSFSMTPEQIMVFADEDSPVMMVGSFQVAAAMVRSEDQVVEAFRTGRGVGWHEHHDSLFCGCARSFRSAYIGNLVQAWLPALDGVTERLAAGGIVADVGCGFGESTLIMARAFPKARFVGIDAHPDSIAHARAAAERAGLADRVTFDVGRAQDFPGKAFDLICCFDALHDMGDPVTAAAHVREALDDDGIFMLVEPFAGDRLEDNLTPVGRMYYAASTMLCTPASRSQEGAMCLGAQAGEARLRQVLDRAGFSRVRRAAETPLNLVLEARP